MGKVKEHTMNMTDSVFELCGYDQKHDDEVWNLIQEFIMKHFTLNASIDEIVHAWIEPIINNLSSITEGEWEVIERFNHNEFYEYVSGIVEYVSPSIARNFWQNYGINV